MKIKKNGEIINLTESDLKRIVKKSLLKEETMEWDYSQKKPSETNLTKQDEDNMIHLGVTLKHLEKRLGNLEVEVHGDMDGEKFTDKSLQKQVEWLSSGMDELSNTVTRILKHIKL